jgi:DNA-binding IclR family transcriptional regulator
MANEFVINEFMPSPSKPRQRAPVTPKPQRGIQSMEVGGQLLQALAHRGRALPLKDLAAEANMIPAKAHPYLVSLSKLGLVMQDEASGHYGLGPLALQLGLMSLQQVDPLQLASQRLPALAQALNLTLALAVWGSQGPTIVRIEAAPTAVHISMRHGTVMSLQHTASGQLFAAYLPEETVRAAWLESTGEKRRVLPWSAAWRDQLARVRAEGVAVSRDAVIPGVTALAAPIFEPPGRMVVALIALGPTAVLDARASKAAIKQLRDAATAISQQSGANRTCV